MFNLLPFTFGKFLQVYATRHCRKTHEAFTMIPFGMAFKVKLL